MTPSIRFGRIHVLSPEFVGKLKTPVDANDQRTYLQRLEATLQDEAPSADNPWLHQSLWDNRHIVLTNTDTDDAARYSAYRSENFSKAAGGPRERRLIDEYITENSHQKLYFDA